MEKSAQWLSDQLGCSFNEPRLLEQALTHRSASKRNNERLEFLGDAVLDLVISEMVYARRPDADEGELSRLRASLVRKSTLAGIATELDFGRHIVLGAGEKKSGGHRRSSILADAFEAVIGAVYLDQGFEVAATVIRRAFENRAASLPDADTLKDPKTRLQEFLQGEGMPLPVYKTTSVTGKAHRQHFEVLCVVQKHELQREQTTSGNGGSRRDAEQSAATAMLARLQAHR